MDSSRKPVDGVGGSGCQRIDSPLFSKLQGIRAEGQAAASTQVTQHDEVMRTLRSIDRAGAIPATEIPHFPRGSLRLPPHLRDRVIELVSSGVAGGAMLKNENCVYLNVDIESEGLRLSAPAPGGVLISLEDW